MYIKNISSSTVKFEEFDNLILEPGETGDLSKYSRSARTKSDKLTSYLHKGICINVGGRGSSPSQTRDDLLMAAKIRALGSNAPLIPVIPPSYESLPFKVKDSFGIDKRAHAGTQKSPPQFRYDSKLQSYLRANGDLPENEQQFIGLERAEKLSKPPLRDQFENTGKFKPSTYQQKYINNATKDKAVITPGLSAAVDFTGRVYVPSVPAGPGVIDSELYTDDRIRMNAMSQIYEDKGQEHYEAPRLQAIEVSQCGATTKTGKRCKRASVKGYLWCSEHLPPDQKEKFQEASRSRFLAGKK